MDYNMEEMSRDAQYVAIKRLIDESFEPVDNKKYEDFVRKLIMILGL